MIKVKILEIHELGSISIVIAVKVDYVLPHPEIEVGNIESHIYAIAMLKHAGVVEDGFGHLCNLFIYKIKDKVNIPISKHSRTYYAISSSWDRLNDFDLIDVDFMFGESFVKSISLTKIEGEGEEMSKNIVVLEITEGGKIPHCPWCAALLVYTRTPGNWSLDPNFPPVRVHCVTCNATGSFFDKELAGTNITTVPLMFNFNRYPRTSPAEGLHLEAPELPDSLKEKNLPQIFHLPPEDEEQQPQDPSQSS